VAANDLRLSLSLAETVPAFSWSCRIEDLQNPQNWRASPLAWVVDGETAHGQGVSMTGSIETVQRDARAVSLLQASLAADRQGNRVQVAHVAFATISPVLVAFFQRTYGAESQVPDLIGIAAAAISWSFLYRQEVWTERGSRLRSAFERMVFGMPDWSRPRIPPQLVVRALARKWADAHPYDAASRGAWFVVRRPRDHWTSVREAQQETLRYGADLRLLWAIALASFLSVVVFCLALGAVQSSETRSEAMWNIVVSVFPLTSVAAMAARSLGYRKERLRLLGRLQAADAAGVDGRLLALVAQERMDTLRRRRVLIPNWFYEMTRGLVTKMAK
jgi:hypothetical protein